jgi:hypothetical protein
MEHPFTEEQVRMIERDLLDFTRGKRRLVHVKRWIAVQRDELTAQKAAAYIADRFRAMLMEGWTTL